MLPTTTEIVSIQRLRQESLLGRLHLHELGMAAMSNAELRQAEELRNRQLAAIGMQSV